MFEKDIYTVFASKWAHRGSVLHQYSRELLSQLEKGHICIPIDEKDTNELLKESLIGDTKDVLQPFIIEQNKLYLQRYYVYETEILNTIKSLLKREVKNSDSRKNWLEENKNILDGLFGDYNIEGVTVDVEKFNV